MRFHPCLTAATLCTIAGLLLGASAAPPPQAPPPRGNQVSRIAPPEPLRGEGIEVVVWAVDAQTGDAIPGVQVELRRQRIPPTDLREWIYMSTTDAQGKSTIANIVADRYSITPTLKGRMLADAGAQTVTFAPSAKPTLVFRMFKASALEGTVQDTDRNPVALAAVELLEERWTAGKRTLARIQISLPTDATGKFSFAAVIPGSYYLRARPAPMVVQDQLKRSDSLPDPDARHVAYVNTLYPNSPFLETATPIVLYPEVNHQGVRIEVQKSKYYTVRGQVGNLAPAVRGPGLIFIRTVTFDSRFPFIAAEPYDEAVPTEIAPDGTFSYELGIPPGQYWAGYTPGGQGNRFGGMDFRVTDRDVELKTELWEGFPFEGKVIFEDGTPAAGLAFRLRTFWSQRSIRVDDGGANAQGAFTRPLYSDGIFRIEFPNSAVAVRKIEKDSRTYYGPEFEVIRNGGPAVITLTRKGASISGSVELHKSTKGHAHGMVTISLDPANPLDTLRRKRLDGSNTFMFDHLEAGRYRMCAWVEEGNEINRVLGNPSYDQRLSTLCQSVEVKDDETKSTDLRQISALEVQ